MNRFAKSYASGATIVRDCCDNPPNCIANINGAIIRFKLGVLTHDTIIYAERASDRCGMFGNPAGYEFTIEGKKLDLREVGPDEAIVLVARAIDDLKQPECLIQDDDDFVV